VKATNVQRYLQMVEDLRKVRRQESGLLEKMDLLWQAMGLEEREEIHKLNLSWPPPALITQQDEDDNGNA
jgi:hypothetical protein